MDFIMTFVAQSHDVFGRVAAALVPWNDMVVVLDITTTQHAATVLQIVDISIDIGKALHSPVLEVHAPNRVIFQQHERKLVVLQSPVCHGQNPANLFHHIDMRLDALSCGRGYPVCGTFSVAKFCLRVGDVLHLEDTVLVFRELPSFRKVCYCAVFLCTTLPAKTLATARSLPMGLAVFHQLWNPFVSGGNVGLINNLSFLIDHSLADVGSTGVSATVKGLGIIIGLVQKLYDERLR